MDLSQENSVGIKRPMGRPPLHVVETKIRLTIEQKERIIALVGPCGMAKLVREAVEAELARREIGKE